jgi:hypothetical protein
MYRFDGKLSPGSDHKEALRAFVLGGYAATQALEVPPVPSAFDWAARNAQHKLEAVKAALQAQVQWRRGPASILLTKACQNHGSHPSRLRQLQDLKALAIALLPVLGVCLLAMALMAVNLTKKTKRE